MDNATLERMLSYIREHANLFGEIILVDDFYDSYSIAYRDGKLILINFSPRENSIYSSKEITPEEAFDRLRSLL